jgi:chromosome transmission fidelity protein 1
MGGKLSEGINFSDKLARCVVMVGMPFPDSRDPVLKEKLKFADTLEPNSGKKLYEAMCMKTVNQCIGRSIRHANDYASILLLDARYSQPRITNLLPSWLASEVKSCSTFGDAQSSLLAFFAERKEAEEKDSI